MIDKRFIIVGNAHGDKVTDRVQNEPWRFVSVSLHNFSCKGILLDAPLIKVDDKWIPLYRVVWVADVPHFCGESDCMHEGDYEIRLDVDDSIWSSSHDRDAMIAALKKWCGDPRGEEGGGWS